VAQPPELYVTEGGQRVALDMPALRELVEAACANLGADVKAEPIMAETRRNLYDGVPLDEVFKAAIMAARTLIEKEPSYTRATARLLLHTIRREILGENVTQGQMATRYAEYFPQFIKKGVQAELLDEKLMQFDLVKLGAALDASRDLQFDYLGLTSCTSRKCASRCRRRFSCAWPWGWRSVRSTAKRVPSSSTTCSPASTS